MKILIPGALRKYTDGQKEVEIDARYVGDALYALEEKYPGLKERILTPTGHVVKFANVFVGSENIVFLEGLDTAVSPSDTIDIIPAIAGG